MSNKFSRRGRTNVRPPVCHPPPEGPLYQPPLWPRQPYEGFVNLLVPYSGWTAQILGTLKMIPNPPARIWNGSITNPPGTLEVEMYWYEPGNYLMFDLTLFYGPSQMDQWAWSQIKPRSWAPFDSGFLYSDPPPIHGRVGFRILA